MGSTAHKLTVARPRALGLAGEIPRLRRLPVLGNLLDLHRDRLGLLRRVYEECGEVGAFTLGPRPIYVFTSPRYAGEILVDKARHFEKGPMLRLFARPFLGDGLVSCLNADHARRRKAAAPAFQRRRIAGYVDQMAALTESAVDQWADGETLMVYDELRRLSMRVIGKTLFDVDLEGAASDLARSLDVGMAYISDRLRQPFHLPLAIPTPRNLRVRRAIRHLDRFFEELIETRRSEGVDRGDVLSAYLFGDAEERLSDAELIDDFKTMFFAGFETTTSALAFAWSKLGQYPGALSRLQREVDCELGDRLPGADDLSRIPFSLQVVKESLRLYPPAHTLGRVANSDVIVGDYELPKGAVVLVSPYLMHRRPQSYRQPEVFEPARFAPDREQARARHEYMPFGGGARACLGGYYALTEAHVVMAVISRRFELCHEAEPPPVETLMTLRPLGGLPMIARRRY